MTVKPKFKYVLLDKVDNIKYVIRSTRQLTQEDRLHTLSEYLSSKGVKKPIPGETREIIPLFPEDMI